MSPESDYYALLQVDPRADLKEIQAAYRVLARRHHPDVTGGSHEHMAALNTAWAVLRDPEARMAYDRARAPRPSSARVASSAAAEDAAARVRRPSAQGSGSVLDFGRYAGWTLGEVARSDPDFLEWLARTPIGRRYRSEIEGLLGSAKATAMPAGAGGRPGRSRGFMHR